MARLVGILPALAVFAALPLDKLASELVLALGRSGPRPRRAAQALSSAVLVALLAFLTWRNFTDYYRRYVGPWAFSEATGQAVFVRDMRRAMAEQGRPEPTFHHLAVHLLYWDYGVNRFLNHTAQGEDVANVSSSLPLVDADRGDAVFMVWDVNSHYLPVLRSYYPGGEARRFVYGPPERSTYLFTSYRVTREEIESRRTVTATYTGASASPVRRAEPGLGTEQPRPASLVYPVRARWAGGLFSPQFALRRFRLLGPDGARLRIDGALVASVQEGGVAEGEAALARGLHALEVTGSLADASTQIALQWSGGLDAWTAIPRRLLWSGPGRGLVGEVRPLGPYPFGEDSREAAVEAEGPGSCVWTACWAFATRRTP